MMFRKGLSGVVVSMLLISLSLAAVGLLGIYINKAVDEAELSPSFSCLEMQLNPTIRFQKACYNNNTGDFELSVFRGGDGLNLKNIYFILNFEDGGSRKLCCGDGCDSCDVLEDGKSKDYYFSGLGLETKGNSILQVLNCGVSEIEIEECDN